MAGAVRLELTTCGFGDRCSSQLSYTPIRPGLLRLIRHLSALNNTEIPCRNYADFAGNRLAGSFITEPSAGFLVNGMFAFEGAIFALFDTVRSVAFFFHRSIVTTFAFGALQSNLFTSHNKLRISLIIPDGIFHTVRDKLFFKKLRQSSDYLTISETRPEATVRPPSRIAKRRPLSIAIGAISSTLMETLSPGITISVPSGRVMVPVTSVVRK